MDFNEVIEYLDSNVKASNAWNKFVYSSKERKPIDDPIIKEAIDVISQNTLFIPCDTVLYRARIVKNTEIYMLHMEDSHKARKNGHTGFNGFDKQNMMAPPQKKASAGRANHSQISILYLADTPETAMCEIRAGFMDYISVAKFRLNKQIKVVDLAHLIYTEKELFRRAQMIFCLKAIMDAFTQPYNEQNDSIYAPTQYIAEIMKAKKLDGIKYASGRNNHNGGHFNIAIYDPSLAECIDDYGNLYQCTQSHFYFENITSLSTVNYEAGIEFDTPKWENDDIIKHSDKMRFLVDRLNDPNDILFVGREKSTFFQWIKTVVNKFLSLIGMRNCYHS
ncbi:MAG: RES family NAD+ phosphorylase [Victivallales bacterium]|nr:RES family NAD+ phosphorylase [Victivallales bacterium]